MPLEASGRVRSVLVVDDSSAVRRFIGIAINRDPKLEVVGEATNGRDALKKVEQFKPDAVVLDVHMPIMGGLEVLPMIQRCSPDTRVVLFSSKNGSVDPEVSNLVDLGSVDFVAKPSGVDGTEGALEHLNKNLLPRLRHDMAGASEPGWSKRKRRRRTPASAKQIDAIVIGSSTGGPSALEHVIGRLPADIGLPIFVVQHISKEFAGSLAEHLDRSGPLKVVEATRGMKPEAGVVYVAPGHRHMVLNREHGQVVIHFDGRAPVNSCRPSVDVLFESSAPVYGPHQIGLILTGMGQDGLDGCRALGKRGAPILIQDEATSVIWGMPGAVARAGLSDEVLPLDEISERLFRWVATSRTSKRPGRNV